MYLIICLVFSFFISSSLKGGCENVLENILLNKGNTNSYENLGHRLKENLVEEEGRLLGSAPTNAERSAYENSSKNLPFEEFLKANREKTRLVEVSQELNSAYRRGKIAEMDEVLKKSKNLPLEYQEILEKKMTFEKLRHYLYSISDSPDRDEILPDSLRGKSSKELREIYEQIKLDLDHWENSLADLEDQEMWDELELPEKVLSIFREWSEPHWKFVSDVKRKEVIDSHPIFAAELLEHPLLREHLLDRLSDSRIPQRYKDHLLSLEALDIRFRIMRNELYVDGHLNRGGGVLVNRSRNYYAATPVPSTTTATQNIDQISNSSAAPASGIAEIEKTSGEKVFVKPIENHQQKYELGLEVGDSIYAPDISVLEHELTHARLSEWMDQNLDDLCRLLQHYCLDKGPPYIFHRHAFEIIHEALAFTSQIDFYLGLKSQGVIHLDVPYMFSDFSRSVDFSEIGLEEALREVAKRVQSNYNINQEIVEEFLNDEALKDVIPQLYRAVLGDAIF